jgi:hypothetical protein
MLGKRNGGAGRPMWWGRLVAALQPDETVIGGGNVIKLDPLPP